MVRVLTRSHIRLPSKRAFISPLVWIVSLSIKNMQPIRALASTLIIAVVGAMGMILAPSEGSGFTTVDLGVVLGMVGSDPVMTLSGL